MENQIKPCELIEYCGDFHVIGKNACEGVKNPDECPLLIDVKNNQYTDRFKPLP